MLLTPLHGIPWHHDPKTLTVHTVEIHRLCSACLSVPGSLLHFLLACTYPGYALCGIRNQVASCYALELVVLGRSACTSCVLILA